MAERDKLNISFQNLKDITQMQTLNQFKIQIRNNLGVRQADDWIYQLRIDSIMRLNLMNIDELSPISSKINKSSIKGGDQTTFYNMSSLIN